jgi:hypothetical protein
MKMVFWAGVIITLMLSVCASAFAATDSQPAIMLDGTNIEAVASVDKGNVYLPLRAVGEALGYEVQWSENDSTISVSRPEKDVIIDLINYKVTANDHAYYMGDYTIIEDRTHLGTDFFSENLGLRVGWDRENGIIHLESVHENAISIKTIKEASETDIIKTTLQYPQIDDLDDKTVQDRINSIFSKKAEEARNEGLKNADEMEKAMASGYTGNPNKCETYFDYRLKYNQNGLLSVVFLDYQYSGGAHGLTVQSSHTFDLKTGEEYRLKDLVISDADYVAFISNIVKAEIDARIKEGVLPDYSIAPFEAIKEDQDFYLSNDAVVVYFQQYEYFPYAAGIQEFPVEFSALKDILKPEVLQLTDVAGGRPVAKIDAGTFSISVPRDWTVEMFPGSSLSFKKNNEEIGACMIMNYDPSLPLSQFQGNHAEALSTKQLEGFSYPTTEVVLRRTQPAAANDTSYVDELHIYLIPENSKFAYDLYFDSSKVDEKTVIEIADSVILNVTHTQQILDIAGKWAEAVKNRDGKAQYDLLSAERQSAVYDEYNANHWTTGTSSPWVENYVVKASGNEAIITYDYATSTGSAGKYQQTLSFIVEDGTYYIDYFNKPENIEMSVHAGDLIGTIKKNQTQLHAVSVDDGMISGITVSIGDKKKSFLWETLDSESFMPKLFYADVDSDNNDELIIILCTGEGTGVLTEDIHVLKPDDFSEITVENPLDTLKSRVHTQITEKDVQITIDQKSPIVFPESEVIDQIAMKNSWFENLVMGSIVDYEMDNNRITVRVGAQLSPAGFLGDFVLAFEYTDHELKVSDIVFSSYIKDAPSTKS